MRSSMLAALAAVLTGATACAAGDDAADDAVAVQGCPIAGVEAGCVMVVAPDGQTYDITAAAPKPALDGRPIRLTGTRSGEMSSCMQGTRLTGIAWSYTAGNC